MVNCVSWYDLKAAVWEFSESDVRVFMSAHGYADADAAAGCMCLPFITSFSYG